MGLLDALLSNNTDTSGGLLSFLQNNALNQQMPSGLASDQAQYAQQPVFAPQAQPSPLDNAQWPAGPVGAPSQANAQAIPQNPPAPIMAQPMQQPETSPSIGDRLGMGFKGMAANMPAGPLGMLMGGIAGVAGLGQPSAANQTAKALLAKGVDPQTVQAAVANPELMKTLIAQTYGPKNIQSIGDGYVYDPQSGKVVRAYTPEKQPLSIGNGYIIKDGKVVRAYEPEDKIPAGYERTPDGAGLQFIKGGPEDPATKLRLSKEGVDPNRPQILGRGGEIFHRAPNGEIIIDHKNNPDNGPGLTDDSTEILARREIGGDFSGRKNLGRGAQGAKALEAITNKTADILTNEYGMSKADAASYMSKKMQDFNAQGIGLNAEARTSAVREANLNLVLKAADAAIPAALEASDKVARTGWVPLNKIIQGGEVIASDPDLRKFGMANLQLAEHWARAMNPTGVMRESDRDMALHFLSTADSKETYKQVVEQLRTQIQRERDAVASTRGMSTLPGVTPEKTAAPLAPGASTTINGVTIKRVN